MNESSLSRIFHTKLKGTVYMCVCVSSNIKKVGAIHNYFHSAIGGSLILLYLLKKHIIIIVIILSFFFRTFFSS